MILLCRKSLMFTRQIVQDTKQRRGSGLESMPSNFPVKRKYGRQHLSRMGLHIRGYLGFDYFEKSCNAPSFLWRLFYRLYFNPWHSSLLVSTSSQLNIRRHLTHSLHLRPHEVFLNITTSFAYSYLRDFNLFYFLWFGRSTFFLFFSCFLPIGSIIYFILHFGHFFPQLTPKFDCACGLNLSQSWHP